MLLKDPRRTAHAINNRVTVNVPMTTLDVEYITEKLNYTVVAKNLNLNVTDINRNFSEISNAINNLDSEFETIINQVNDNTECIEHLTNDLSQLSVTIDALTAGNEKLIKFMNLDNIEQNTLQEFVADSIANTRLGMLSDVNMEANTDDDGLIPRGSILSFTGTTWVAANNVDGGVF